MRRILLPLLTLLALAGGPARAQTNPPALVGSWLVAFTPPGSTTPALAVIMTCHPDGTVTAMQPGFGDSAGAGAWVSNPDGQFAITTLHFDQNPPPSDNPVIGFLKLRLLVSVSGGTMSAVAEAITTDLTFVVQQDITGLTVTGTPIVAEQIGAQ